MSLTVVIKCDYCGLSLEGGPDRQWRLALALEAARTPDVYSAWKPPAVGDLWHFCDPSCLASWAAERSVTAGAERARGAGV